LEIRREDSSAYSPLAYRVDGTPVSAGDDDSSDTIIAKNNLTLVGSEGFIGRAIRFRLKDLRSEVGVGAYRIRVVYEAKESGWAHALKDYPFVTGRFVSDEIPLTVVE
jgi:hypothetical protein